MQWFSKQILTWASQERTTFTRQFALANLTVTEKAFENASQRAIARGELLHPRRGLYVIVAPMHWAAGAPPTMDVIAGLMDHEGTAEEYYVGLRKAAELHQILDRSPTNFQIISTKRMSDVLIGRSRLEFYSCARMPAAELIERREAKGGVVAISRPELTAADLVRYPAAAGANAFELLFGLAGGFERHNIRPLVESVPQPTLQRLGFAFDRVGQFELADELFQHLGSNPRAVSWSGMVDRQNREAIYDTRWKVYCYRSELPTKD